MTDELAYWTLDETERMKMRLLAARRAAEASADAMRQRGPGAGEPHEDQNQPVGDSSNDDRPSAPAAGAGGM